MPPAPPQEMPRAGAQPLREGEQYCAKHTEQPARGHVLDGTVCASCDSAHGLLSKDPSDADGAWYCQRCWDEWERDDPLAAVWPVLFGC